MKSHRVAILDALAHGALTRDELSCHLTENNHRIHDVELAHELTGLSTEKRIITTNGKFDLCSALKAPGVTHTTNELTLGIEPLTACR